MDDEDIRQRVDDLDAAVGREGARLLIYCESPDQDSCEFIGNRQGYLRAGIELIRAALAPLAPGDSITPIKIDYLIGYDRSLQVKRLTRQEDVYAGLPGVRENSWKDKIIGIGCLALVIFFGVCGFIGVGQVFSWIFGK
jgi:hypothetical protein